MSIKHVCTVSAHMPINLSTPMSMHMSIRMYVHMSLHISISHGGRINVPIYFWIGHSSAHADGERRGPGPQGPAVSTRLAFFKKKAFRQRNVEEPVPI